MSVRFTKTIPTHIYFTGGIGGWYEGPYVNPKSGRTDNKKFAITEVPMGSKLDPVQDVFEWLKEKDYLTDNHDVLYQEYLKSKK